MMLSNMSEVAILAKHTVYEGEPNFLYHAKYICLKRYGDEIKNFVLKRLDNVAVVVAVKVNVVAPRKYKGSHVKYLLGCTTKNVFK